MSEAGKCPYFLPDPSGLFSAGDIPPCQYLDTACSDILLMSLTDFDVFATVAIAFLVLMLFLALFEPGLRYHTKNLPTVSTDSDDFIRIPGILAKQNTVEVRSRIEQKLPISEVRESFGRTFVPDSQRT